MLDRYPYDRDIIEGLLDLILETVLSRNDEIEIARNRYPSELVRSRFLKLDFGHMEYVLGCMKDNTAKVRNIKKVYAGSAIQFSIYGGKLLPGRSKS